MAASKTGSRKRSRPHVQLEKTEKKVDNEIDAIFAAKKKAKVTKPTPESKASTKASKTASTTASSTKPASSKTPSESPNAIEEVVFSELAAVKGSLKPKTPASSAASLASDPFADSRGLHTKRKTDDGYPLYDVKDLRIGEGGDTPECPFDCQCCY